MASSNGVPSNSPSTIPPVSSRFTPEPRTTRHRGVVTRIAVGQTAVRVEHGVEQGDEASLDSATNERRVDRRHRLGWALSHVRLSGQRALEHRPEQRRGRALAGHVTQRKPEDIVGKIDVVKEISTN